MRPTTLVVALVLACFAQAGLAQRLRKPGPRPVPRSLPQVDPSPLRFEANLGQADNQVKFLSRGLWQVLFLTQSGDAVLSLCKPKRQPSATRKPPPRHRSSGDWDFGAIRMSLVGSRQPAKIEGLSPLPTVSNYFIGKDPRKWLTNVVTYQRAAFRGVYPGVDLIYYGTGTQIEYDFVLAPGADPSAIGLEYHGPTRIDVTPQGDLCLTCNVGEVYHKQPVAYQLVNGIKKTVACAYRRIGRTRVGLNVGAFDRALPLVIDPVLAYSSYLGGNAPGSYGGDEVMGLAVDSAGNAYLAGQAESTNFPVFPASPGGVVQPGFGGGSLDCFVTKFNASGSAPVYSTYLGGNGHDVATGLAIDASGNSYVTGWTQSTNFPLQSAFLSTPGGTPNAFAAKLSPTGASLVYSTYLLAGSAYSQAEAIAVDSTGRAYVVGTSASQGFFCILNSAATALALNINTFGGGHAYAVAVDSQGNAYIGGETAWPYASGYLTPAQAGWQTTFGGYYDASVEKYTSAGALVYFTYVGGSDYERGLGIAIDASGAAYLGGFTWSANYPTANAYQASLRGTQDGFLAKLSPDGKSAAYSTYLGGSDMDDIFAVAVAAGGLATVVGPTWSQDFPTVSPVSAHAPAPGDIDAFVTTFGASGQSLAFSTCLGGTYADDAQAVALDSSGNIYVGGRTQSSNFPVQNAYQPTIHGGMNAWFAKITGVVPPGPILAITGISPSPAGIGTTVNVTVSSNETLTPDPTLTIGGQSATLAIKSGLTFTFRRTLLGNEGQPAPSIVVSGTNTAGITTVLTNSGLTTDFNAPSVTSASVTPPQAGLGTVVTATFTASEGLRVDPVVKIGTKLLSKQSASGLTYTYVRPLDGTETAGTLSVTAGITDIAGNFVDRTLGTVVTEFTPPSFTSISAQPNMAKVGTPVTIAFNSSEALAGNPSVTVGAQAATFASRSSLSYTYTLNVSTTAGSPSPTVSIRGGDVYGNTGTSTANPLTTDFVAPSFTNMAAAPSLAKSGTLVTLSFGRSEPLPANPVVTVGGQPATFASFSSPTYSYTLNVTSAVGAPNPLVSIQGTDAAGNAGTSTGTPLTTDFVPPSFTGITASPSLARVGTNVTVQFTRSETLSGNPTVLVGSQAATFASLAGSLYSYTLSVSTSAGGPQPVISVQGSDAAGNSGTSTAQPLATDFVVPSASNLSVAPSPARTGTDVTISFTQSEALAASPLVTIGGKAAPFASSSSGSFVYRRTIDGSETEGAASVSVALEDLAGNTGTTTTTALLDFHPPVASFVSIQPSSADVGTTVTITVDVNETLASTPALTIGGKAASLLSTSGLRHQFQRPIDGSEGSGTPPILFTAQDLAGNVGTAQSTGLNTTFGPLSLTVAVQPEAAKRDTTVTISVDSTKVLTAPPTVILGELPVALVSQSGRHYVFSRTLLGSEPQGATTIHVSAQATSGEVATDESRSVVVDFIAPLAGTLSTTPSYATTGSTVEIAFSASETLASTPVVKIGSADASLYSKNQSDYVFRRTVQDADGAGTKTVSVALVDPAGNTTTDASHSVTLDFEAPDLINIRATPRLARVTTRVTLTFDATEALTANPSVAVGSESAAFVSQSGLAYVYLFTPSVSTPAGSPLVSILGSDLAGNVGAGSARPFTRDIELPTFKSITAAPPVAGPSTLVTIGFTASEPILIGPNVSIGGAPATQVTSSGLDYTFSVTADAPVPEGTPSVVIQGVDFAGNFNSTSGTPLLVDRTVPAVQLGTPPGSPVEGSGVGFSSSGSTARSGITAYSWTFGDGGSSNQQNPAHTYVDNGMYTVTLMVTSAVGLSASTQKTLTVQNVAPTVAFDAIPNPARQLVNVTWRVSDPGSLDTIRCTITAKDLLSGTSTQLVKNEADTGSVSWDTTKAAESTFQLAITVTDKDGGQGAASSNPTIVDNKPLTITPGEPDPQVFNPAFGETTLLRYFLSEHAAAKIDLLTPSNQAPVAELQAVTSTSAGQNSFTWDGKNPSTGEFVPDDNYTYVITGTDDLGTTTSANASVQGFTVTLHTGVLPPTISPTHTSPTRVAALTLRGSKPAGTAIVVSQNGAVVNTSVVDQFLTWSVPITLSEGQNVLSAFAQDSVGLRSAAVSESVTLKTLAPNQPIIDVVQLAPTSPNQTIEGRKDPNTSLLMNNVESVPLGASTTWSQALDYFAGSTPFTFVARDDVGNLSASTTVTIALPPNEVSRPTLDPVVTPINVTTYTVSGTRQPNTTVEVTVIGLDPPKSPVVSIAPSSDTSGWSVSVTGSEGLNAISVRSFDSIRSASLTTGASVFVDTHAPTIQLTGIANGNVTTNSSPVFSLTYQDAAPSSGLNLASLAVFIDGQDYTSDCVIGPNSASIPQFIFPPGQHYMTASVADNAKNTASTNLNTSSATLIFTVIPHAPGDPPVLTVSEQGPTRLCPAYNPYRTVHEDHLDVKFRATETVTPTLQVFSSTGTSVLTTTLPAVTPDQEGRASWNGHTLDGDLVDNGDYVIKVSATSASGKTTSLADMTVRIHY